MLMQLKRHNRSQLTEVAMVTKQPSTWTEKRLIPGRATNWRFYFLATLIALVAGFQSDVMAQQEQSYFPRFRHVDPSESIATISPSEILTLLTDEDFAPWSFKGSDGILKGVSIDLATAACADAEVKCQFKPLPHQDVLTKFRAGEGDLIISGLRMTDAVARDAALTRPYFVSLGRFVTRLGSPLPGADVRSLAGKRLGYVKGSAHGAFLEKYYSRASLTPYENTATMHEALRTGLVDAIFGDSLSLSYWVGGSLSRACCAPLGKAFVDRETFSRNLSFLARRNGKNLRDLFDASLDQLEQQGVTAKIFNAYLPGPVW
jgi:polar amino acid transport system substrate-binding protein